MANHASRRVAWCSGWHSLEHEIYTAALKCDRCCFCRKTDPKETDSVAAIASVKPFGVAAGGAAGVVLQVGLQVCLTPKLSFFTCAHDGVGG
jgi:hypothetical protein